MRRAILSAIVAIAFLTGVSAQDKPNFAGTWKAAASFNTWTITVEGNKMTITMTVAGNSDSTVYLLDGTPSIKTIEGPNGTVENVYTSTWDGNVLVTKITGPGMERVERRSIEADGTMKLQTVFTMMGGKPAPPPPPGAGAGMVFTRAGQPTKTPTVAVSAAILDRYVGEYTSASGFVATFRRDGTLLFVKPGANDEEALIPRTETRFQDPRGPVFEFQVDGQGKVTGAVLEQQGPQGMQKIPLQRK